MNAVPDLPDLHAVDVERGGRPVENAVAIFVLLCGVALRTHIVDEADPVPAVLTDRGIGIRRDGRIHTALVGLVALNTAISRPLGRRPIGSVHPRTAVNEGLVHIEVPAVLVPVVVVAGVEPEDFAVLETGDRHPRVRSVGKRRIPEDRVLKVEFFPIVFVRGLEKVLVAADVRDGLRDREFVALVRVFGSGRGIREIEDLALSRDGLIDSQRLADGDRRRVDVGVLLPHLDKRADVDRILKVRERDGRQFDRDPEATRTGGKRFVVRRDRTVHDLGRVGTADARRRSGIARREDEADRVVVKRADREEKPEVSSNFQGAFSERIKSFADVPLIVPTKVVIGNCLPSSRTLLSRTQILVSQANIVTWDVFLQSLLSCLS